MFDKVSIVPSSKNKRNDTSAPMEIGLAAAVARDILYVTRMIGGFVPVLFSTNFQTFPVSP